MGPESSSQPSMDAMLTQKYSLANWLNFYHNVWTRNLAACLTDVQADTTLLASDPEALTAEPVKNAVGQMMLSEKGEVLYKRADERLEERKASVQNSIDILAAIDALEQLSPEDLAAKWSPEALAPKVAPATEDAAAPAEVATADTTLVSFTVQPGKAVSTTDGVAHGEGEKVNLNPTDAQTIEWVEGGYIAPTTAGI